MALSPSMEWRLAYVTLYSFLRAHLPYVLKPYLMTLVSDGARRQLHNNELVSVINSQWLHGGPSG